jgi:ABC-type multidrug transport system ATPase subunit
MSVRVTSLEVYGREGFSLGPVSLSVEDGHALAVLGGPRAGKTLLLSALAGLLSPRNVVRGVLERPDSVAMVFQRDALADDRTALENVAAAARARSIPAPREAARAALARVGLAGDVEKLPRALSGGMRKRVGIARALAVRPRLLLADDPTAGLDPETARDVLALLLEPAHDDLEGPPRAVLIATQDVDVVLPRVEQALVLEGGEPAFLGTPTALADHPSLSIFAARSHVHRGATDADEKTAEGAWRS